MQDFGYQPRWRRQLDGSPNASVNCGVIATGVGNDMQTKGKVRPQPNETRRRMRAPSGPTNMWDVDRAVDSYTSGLPKPYVRLRGRRETEGDSDATWRTVMDWLPSDTHPGRHGRAVVLGVHYGMLRSAAPKKTGSDTFDGWHGITLTAVRVRRRIRNGRRVTVRQVRVYDSLNDGRRPGIPGPGPVWIDATKVRDAAFAYGRAVHRKAQRIAGVFLAPGERREKPKPPEPKDPCADIARDLLETRDAIGDAIDDLAEMVTTDPSLRGLIDDVIADLRAALPSGVSGDEDGPADPDAVVESGMSLRP